MNNEFNIETATREDLNEWAREAEICIRAQQTKAIELTKMIRDLISLGKDGEQRVLNLIGTLELLSETMNRASTLSFLTDFEQRMELQKAVQDTLNELVKTKWKKIEWPSVDDVEEIE